MSSQTTNTFRMEEGVDITGKSSVYHIQKILKRRNFGELVQCRNQESGDVFALKCVRKKYLKKYKQEAKILEYLGDLNSDQTHLVKFFEVFSYQNWICFVFENLDMTLMDFMGQRQWQPLNMKEIRVIAQQMLQALVGLNHAGITHMDIKPENIMLVNNQSEPLMVKLTGFRNAGRTSKLEELDVPLNCGYSAPEVFLDCPLDQSVDVWGLGCTLAFLYLGFHLFPVKCNYDYMRIIVKVLGQPDREKLDKGWRAEQFFTLTSSWTLKTPEEYMQATGRLLEGSEPVYETLDSLDALIYSGPEAQNPTEFEDKKSFVDLLKKMLALNPEDRIHPAEALNHEFFIKEFLADLFTNCSESVAPENTSGFKYPDSVPPVEIDEAGLELKEETNNLEETPLTLEEGVVIRSSSNVYYVEKVLGAGVFGQVARCRTEGTGELVALKIISQDKEWAAQNEAYALEYVSQLDPDQTNIIRFMECFTFKNCICLVFELLDLSLFDVMEKREWTPLSLDDIRSVTQQMLVTLSALRSIGVTHTDIKTDNIMIVDRYSEDLSVKMIDFGLARATSKLSEFDVMQAISFRAPEVYLGGPRDEGVDVWGLGCVLAFLFLGRSLFPGDEYEVVRIIVKLLGQPDDYYLNTGWQAKRFFTLDQSGKEPTWRLKTPEEFQQDTGEIIEESHPIFDKIQSLDDLLYMAELEGPTEIEDVKSFVDLLKKMLALNPEERIHPADALEHRFITKEHHVDVNKVFSISEVYQATPGGECWDNYPFETTDGNDFHQNESRNNTEETPLYTLGGECWDNDLFETTNSNDFQQNESRNNTEETPLILEEGVVIRGSSNIYYVEEVLGSGAFGQVARVRIEGTGEKVALKIVSQHNERAAENEAGALNYLSQLDPDQTNIMRFVEWFIFKGCYCFVFELLDLSLFDVMRRHHWTPLSLDDIRSVTQQMLVTLRALQCIGVTHTDIKPDNIMIVDRYSKQFRVKMIDFGLAEETSQMSEYDVMQAYSYRAPEVHLGNPRNECVDMWGLGCTLAFLFLGHDLCPDDEYNALRIIVKLLGQPDDYFLHTGWQAKRFFTLDQSGSELSWRLKTPEEFQQDTGEIIEESHPIFDKIQSLDDLLNLAPELEGPTGIEDVKSFVDLLKKMLALNPEERIHPADALEHRFITKEHHVDVNKVFSISEVYQATPGGERWDNYPFETTDGNDFHQNESRNNTEETPLYTLGGECWDNYPFETTNSNDFEQNESRNNTEETPLYTLGGECWDNDPFETTNSNDFEQNKSRNNTEETPLYTLGGERWDNYPFETTNGNDFEQNESRNDSEETPFLYTGTPRSIMLM